MTKTTNHGKKRKAEDEEIKTPEKSSVEDTPPPKKHKAAVREERQDSSPERTQTESARTKKKKKSKEEDDNVNVKPAAKKSSKSGKEEIVNEKSKSPKKVKEEKVKSLKAINNKDSDKNKEASLEESMNQGNLTQAELSVFGSFPNEWNKEEHTELFRQIQTQLPEDDCTDYSKTLKKIDWTKVDIPGRDSSECMAEYHCILKKLRKYKTMTEVLTDARKWLEEDSGRIKKPLLPQMLYYIAHRAKYISKHPDLNLPEVAAKLNKKFEKLPDSKKKKYIDKHNEEMKAYKVEVTRAKKFAIPPKFPMTPMRVYIESKYKQEKDSGKSKNDIYLKYKKKWHILAKDEKVKFIRQALELRAEYKEQLKVYCQTYPDYKPPFKVFLTKSEQRIKDEFDGKPMKPAASGYMLFTKENHHKFADVPFNERTNQISKAWKDLSEEKRGDYNRRTKEMNEQYAKNLKAYREKHPEQEDDDELQMKKAKKKQKMEMEAKLKPAAKVVVKEEEEEEDDDEEEEDDEDGDNEDASEAESESSS